MFDIKLDFWLDFPFLHEKFLDSVKTNFSENFGIFIRISIFLHKISRQKYAKY